MLGAKAEGRFNLKRGVEMAENLAWLFLLDPEVTFLNHGSFGACPRPVFEDYQRWHLKLERQPVAFLDPDRGLSGWMRDTRAALAAEIGAQPQDNVGPTNATAGPGAGQPFKAG